MKKRVYFLSAGTMSMLGLVSMLTLATGSVADTAVGQGSADLPNDTNAKATFAGGCFWCMEAPFEKLAGVTAVISGYSGGELKNPSYKQVSSGNTAHLEVVQVHYDPSQVSYEQLLAVYWQQFDPTDAGGSFVDRGKQYSSAIFFHNAEQQQQAEVSLATLDDSGRFPKPIVTPVRPFAQFYPAEEYHQDYYRINPIRYHYYRSRSGRDQFLDKIWGESREESPKYKLKYKQQSAGGSDKAISYQRPSDAVLKARLTPLQYQVTRENATERSFDNPYWDNKREGIYVDIVSGEPLFSSTDKYVSGTGWPSFTRPIQGTDLVHKEDGLLFFVRTELRSALADSHLGHLFDDGPAPGGLRYCINSAALRFVAKENLVEEGYGRFLPLFEQ